METANPLLLLKVAEDHLRKLRRAVQLASKPLNVKELPVKSLLDICNGSSAQSVQLGCNLLVQACKLSWIDVPSLIQETEILISTCRHKYLLVSLLCKLLWVEQASDNAASYSCSYSLRLNIHPLISVIQSQPSIASSVVHCVMTLLEEEPSSLSMLEPVIKYLLLCPNNSMLAQADILHQQLLHLAGRSQSSIASPLLDLLMRISAFNQTKDSASLWSTSERVLHFVQLLVDIGPRMLRERNEEGPNFFPSLVLSCLHLSLASCVELTLAALPIHHHLQSFQRLLSLVDGSCPAVTCLALGWLLLQHVVDPPTSALILDVVEEVWSLVAPPFPRLLMLSLIVLLSQTTPTHHQMVMSNGKRATRLLEKVVSSPWTMEQGRDGDNSDDMQVVSAPQLSSFYTELFLTANDFTTRVCFRGSEDGDSDPWLKRVHLKLSSEKLLPAYLNQLSLALCALPTPPISILSQVVTTAPSLAPSLLSYTLYSLSRGDLTPSTQLKLLYLLPCLARDQHTAPLVGGCIASLSSTPQLRPVATRLMGKAWQLRDSLFPQLTELVSRPPLTSDRGILSEWFVAAAAALRDVCTHRAEVRGEDALKLISKLLTLTSNELAIALLVEGLVALGQTEVADIAVLWKLLSSQLSPGNSCVVDIALCQLFMLAAELPCNRAVEKKFKECALKHLWAWSLSNDVKVASEAMSALSEFSLDDHTADVLPAALISHMEESGESPAPIVASGDLVRLVLSTPICPCPGLYTLLQAMAHSELVDMPRGVVYTATQHAQAPNQRDQDVKALWALFKTEITRQPCEGLTMNAHLLVSVDEGLSSKAPFSLQLDKMVHIWTRALSSPQRPRQLQQQSAVTVLNGWQILVGVSSVVAWHEFMVALLRVQSQELGGEVKASDPHWKTVLTRARNKLIHQLMEFVRPMRSQKVKGTEPSQVKGSLECVLQSLMGLLCAELTNPLPDTVLLLSEALTLFVILLKRHVGNRASGGVAGGSGSDFVSGSFGTSPLSPMCKALCREARSLDLIHSLLLSLPTFFSQLSLSPSVIVSCSVEISKLADTLVAIMTGGSLTSSLVCLSLSFLLFFCFPLCEGLSKCVRQVTHLEISPSLSFLLPFLCTYPETCDKSAQTLLSLCKMASSLKQPLADIVCATAAICLPLIVCGGKGILEDPMMVVLLLAELASNSRSPMNHWSLGAGLHGLYSVGWSGVQSLMEELATTWIKEVMEGTAGPASSQTFDQLLSPLMGVSGLLGYNPLAYLCNGYAPTEIEDLLLPLTTSCLSKAVTGCEEGVWLMSQLCHAVSHWKERERVPRNLGYLSSKSILQEMFCYIESGNLANNLVGEKVAEIARAFVGAKPSLPPANWSHLLVPLLQQQDACRHLVARLLVSHGEKTQGFKQLAMHLTTPAVFLTMKEQIQVELLKGVSSLISFIPSTRLSAMLLSATTSLPLSSEAITTSLMDGIKTLVEADTSKVTSHILSVFCQRIFGLISSQSQSGLYLTIVQPPSSLLTDLADCVSQTLQNEELENPFQLLLICCQVRAGRELCSSLESVLMFVLYEQASTVYTVVRNYLEETLRHTCFHGNKTQPQNQLICLSLLKKCSSGKKLAGEQLEVLVALFKCIADPSSQDCSSSVREKCCEAMLTWLSCKDVYLKQALQCLFASVKNSSEYARPLVWTSLTHTL